MAAEGHSYQVHLGPQRPLIRGWVNLASSNPEDAPLIQPNWLTKEQDWVDSRNAIRSTIELMEQDAFKPYRGKMLKPLKTEMHDEGLNDFIRTMRKVAITSAEPARWVAAMTQLSTDSFASGVFAAYAWSTRR